MALPTRPDLPLKWATGSYPAGSDPWSGQPSRVAPSEGLAAQGFDPNTAAPAETANYLHGVAHEWLDYNRAWAAGAVNVRYYDAAGDGVADDTAAINAAVADVPDGGTLLLPPGKYKFTSTLVINRPISIIGAGPASCIWLALTDPTKQGVIIGNPYGTSNAQSQVYRDFSVQGAANGCLNGMAFYQVHRARIENVHVRPGSTAHAVIVGGCLISRFNFIITNNFNVPYDPAGGLWHGAGILVADLRNGAGPVAYPGGAVMPTNGSYFDCIVEAGTTTGGICQEVQDQEGGNNTFQGCYEGLMNADASSVKGAGYSMLIEGGVGFDIRNVHAEGTLHGASITNGQRFSIRESAFTPTPSETLTITSSYAFSIEDCAIGTLTVSTTNQAFSIKRCRGTLDRKTANFGSEATVESWYDDANGNLNRTGGIGQATGGNLMPSGNVARWPLPSTEYSFIGSGAPTATLCGVGQPDTTTRYYAHCIALSNVDANHIPTFPIPHWDRYAFAPTITVWADVCVISNAMLFGVVHGGAYILRAESSAVGTWVRLAMTIKPTADVALMFYPRDTGAVCGFYLGGWGAVIGESAPSGIDAPLPSFSDGLTLGAQRITSGIGLPSTPNGSMPIAGDFYFRADTPSTSGQRIYVCTGIVSGSPNWVGIA